MTPHKHAHNIQRLSRTAYPCVSPGFEEPFEDEARKSASTSQNLANGTLPSTSASLKSAFSFLDFVRSPKECRHMWTSDIEIVPSLSRSKFRNTLVIWYNSSCLIFFCRALGRVYDIVTNAMKGRCNRRSLYEAEKLAENSFAASRQFFHGSTFSFITQREPGSTY